MKVLQTPFTALLNTTHTQDADEKSISLMMFVLSVAQNIELTCDHEE